MLITGLDHVQISAPPGSEDRVREFYGDVLGLPEIPKPPQLQARGGVWYECGDLQLHIGIDEARDSAASATERPRRHVAFRVSDLAAMRQALLAHGFSIDEDQAPLEGARRFYCRDTVGNRVEFIERDTPRAGGLLRDPELLNEYLAGEGDVERVSVAADDGGGWLAAGTSAPEGTRIQPTILIWRLGQAGDPEVEIEMSANVWEMAFSPNGRELACLSEDGSLETWRPGDFESDQFVELPGGSAGLAYSRDGGLLAVGARDTVEVYRSALDQLHTIRPGLGAVDALAFDAHGALAISGEALRIQLWQVKPVQLSSWELLGHEAPVAQMRFNPHHPILAAITEDGNVLLWDVNEGPEAPRYLTGEMDDVNAIAFSPDGEWLACGDEDGRVWLWDWQAASIAARFETRAAVLALAFSPDGAQLVTGEAAGRVRVWKIK